MLTQFSPNLLKKNFPSQDVSLQRNVFHEEFLSECDQIRSSYEFGHIYWRNP